MHPPRNTAALLLLAALVWQGVRGATALWAQAAGPRRPLAFCLGATHDQRLRVLLGPRHHQIHRSLQEHVPRGGWIANRSVQRPLDGEEYVRTRRLAHLLHPRIFRPDLMVLEAARLGHFGPDEPIWLLDLAPEEGAAFPAFEVIDRGPGFTLSVRR